MECWHMYVSYQQQQLQVFCEYNISSCGKDTPPEEVVHLEHGFDFRFSRPKGMWGAGAYFSVSAKNSDAYAFVAGEQMERKAILAVLLTDETPTWRNNKETSYEKRW